MSTNRVVIIGAGFSGTLCAINLLRHDGPNATLIERNPVVGRGTAYSAAHPEHLLNVRAGNMSAFPEDPGHFARWLENRSGSCSTTFAPRRVYGDYLGEMLAEAARAAPGRIEIVADTATRVSPGASGIAVALASGRRIEGGTAVLALGNLPPTAPPPLDPVALGPVHYRGDPWAGNIATTLTAADTVLLLGSGLTMVDAALLLQATGFGGRIVAISRRGLLPRAHSDSHGNVPALAERPEPALRTLVRDVRVAALAIGWHAAIDQLRPFSQSIWRAASSDEQARFLRHLRPWWDVHRHRLAPSVSARIDLMIASGLLTVVAGKPLSYVIEDGEVCVRWRRRTTDDIETIRVRTVVNCTGPQGDLSRAEDEVLRHLVADGLARADLNRLGLDVDAQNNLVGAGGAIDKRLFALGPMTRGAFWEISAVPDIRQQVWTLARKLSNAHWIGGEGL